MMDNNHCNTANFFIKFSSLLKYASFKETKYRVGHRFFFVEANIPYVNDYCSQILIHNEDLYIHMKQNFAYSLDVT